MTTITGIDLGGDGPTIVLGPSLGTSAAALWAGTASRLRERFHVVGFDLPGHGDNRSVDAPFTVGDVADAVAGLVEGPFHYAGDSFGGCVGLQLLLDHRDRVLSAALIATGAQIGDPAAWRERAATVRASGTPTQVIGSAQRWFAPGFIERDPDTSTRLLYSLQNADPEGYALVCEALAGFDVRDRLAEVTAPVLAVAGELDQPTPVEKLREIADGVKAGRLAVVDGAAHLPPAEKPDEVAALLLEHFGSEHE